MSFLLRLRHGLEAHAELVKLRLTGLVAFTAGVGFVLARPTVQWPALAWTTLGTFLASAGAMALNQWWEVERDGKMARTAQRPLVTGFFSRTYGLTLGLIFSMSGLTLLAVKRNWLAAILGLVVVVLYVLVYTPLKVRNPLCTLVGAVCGGLPPMMGWAAAVGELGFGAYLLGFFLFFWQIPHFLSLAWLYRQQYREGGFRMLPEVDPSGALTARYSLLYALATVATTLAFTATQLAGPRFAVAAIFLGFALIYPSWRLLTRPTGLQAKRLFLVTLAYLPLVMGFLVWDRRPPQTVVGATRAQVVTGSSEGLRSLE